MFNQTKIVAAAAAALSTLALPGMALAVPITTDLVSGGVTYHETSCAAGVNGGNTSAPSCGNVEWVASAGGIKIQSVGGTGPLESSNVAGPASNADITLYFTATSIDSNYLSGVNLSIDGGGTRTGVTLTVTSGNYNDGSYTQANINSDTPGVVTAAKTFVGVPGPSTTTSFSADIKAGSIGSSTAGVVNSVSVGVTKVPEPATMTVLLSGLVALGVARRRRR